MMNRQIAAIAVMVAALGLVSPGCVKHRISQKMVMSLTKAVQGAGGGAAGGQRTDEEVFAVVYNQDPELQDFKKYSVVRTRRFGDDVLILVCSPDGKLGLYEDASWTPKVDRKWIKTDRKHPCAWDPSLVPRSADSERK